MSVFKVLSSKIDSARSSRPSARNEWMQNKNAETEVNVSLVAFVHEKNISESKTKIYKERLSTFESSPKAGLA